MPRRSFARDRPPHGYRDRLFILLTFAIFAFGLAQAAALVAAVVHPPSYVTNPYTKFVWWLNAVPALVIPAIPNRALSAAAGLAIGGAVANVVDSVVWPGGVPDFISTPWPASIWNVGDLFLWLGWSLSALVMLFWPITKTRRED